MIQGFEDLRSTIVGRIAEMIARRWLTENGGFSIFEDTCIKYDTAKDFRVFKDGVSYLIEVKGDIYPVGGNIALEHKQETINGEMKPSGLTITQSAYIFYYVFRWDRLYIFKKSEYDRYLSEGWIDSSNSKLCNNDSETGKTECYILDAAFLENDGFFLKRVDNVAASLDITSIPDILGG